MAGTITSDLTAGLIDAADATGTWATIGTAWAAPPVASTDIYLQGTAAMNANCSTAAGIATRFCNVTTAAGLDLTINERHLFFWMKCFCLPTLESRVRGGLGVYISSDAPPTLDSTLAAPWDGPANSKVWFVSGKDFEPTSGWVCYVVDPNGTPDQTLGTPVMTSVDRAGIRVATLLAVGGGAVKPKPFMWDKIAYGTGLTIIDGTAGTPVTLADIYATDSSVTNSFGVLTQAGGIYYVAGKFLFGTTGQTAVTYFKDTNQVIVFQNFPVAATFYEIKLAGAASFATTVQFGNYSGGLTSGGLTIRGASLVERRAIAPVIVSGGTGYTANDILTVTGGTFVTAAQIKVITVSGGVITAARMETAGKYSVPPTGTLATTGGTGGANATFTLTFVGGSIWTLTANAANQTLNLYGCTLSEMKSAALASTTSVRGCSITNSGTVTSNSATIDNCTFQDLATATPISATYALIIASSTEMSTVTNCKFINCNYAIKITAAGTYAFNNLTFSGNSYDIENFSGGRVTINCTNGANPGTYINTAGTFGALSCQSYNANTATYTDEATDINSAGANDVALPPIQATTSGDCIYFGHTVTFTDLTINTGTVGVYSNITINWEYWNGAWVALTVTDNTSGFTVSGVKIVTFTPPGDWAITAINGTTKYWVRARSSWTSGQSKTTSPLATQGWQGSTNISNPITYVLTGLQSGSEVTIVKTSDGTELFHEENVTTGTSTYSYNYTSNIAVDILIHHVGGAVDYEFQTYADTLTNTNKSIPISQAVDRVYAP